MKKIILPHLEQYQKDVLNFLVQNNKDHTIVINSPRQCGKSSLLEILLIYVSMQQGYSTSISISPINAQARKMFKDVNKIAYKLIKSSNSQTLEIEFINGSVIKFFSAESGDNLRGHNANGAGIVVVDEAAYIKDDFYWNIVVPYVNVSHNDIVVASTPKYTQGLFYNLYQQGLELKNNVVTFDWTHYDLSKFLTPDLLERYKHQMPKLAYQCEYLGQFISGDSAVFSNTKACIGTYEIQKDRELVIAIDWGANTGNDDTAITTGQFYDGKIRIEKIITFNNQTTNGTIGKILNAVTTYINQGIKDITIIVETNSIGNIYYSLLVEAIEEYQVRYNDTVNYKNEIDITVGRFTTTNNSKKRIVEQLATLFENENISVPNDNKLISQLTTFECKIEKSGLVTYNAASGFHDDTIISLAICADYLYNNIS